MGDRYCIDSHKITCHPARIAEWLNAGDDWEKLKKIYPLSLCEIRVIKIEKEI